MFCENCGRKYAAYEKFCPDCGTPIRQQKKDKKKKVSRLVVSIIAVIVAIIFVLVAIAVFFFSIYYNSYETMKNIDFGKDKITTVYSSIGKKEIADITDEDDNQLSLEYYYNDLSTTNINKYMQALLKDGFSQVVDDSTLYYTYVKSSLTSNYILLVKINLETDDDNTQYVRITYIKQKGSISDYTIKPALKEGMQEIGSDDYGYIQIPDTWVSYYDANTDNSIQYKSSDGNEMITIDEVSSSSYSLSTFSSYLKESFDESGATTAIKKVTLSNKKAYLLTASTSDVTAYIWIFQDKNGYIHYIGLESYNADSNIFKYINTYYIY